MASNFYTLFKYKPTSIDQTGSALQSDNEFLTMEIGTRILKNDGSEYIKVSSNVFDKVSRKLISYDEINTNFPELDGDNNFTGDNNFQGNLGVDGTGTFDSVVVNDNLNFNKGIGKNLTVDNLTINTNLTSPSATITNITANSLNPTGNGQGSIGTSSLKWGNIYCNTLNGTATSAKYSDLAEKYIVSENLEPATVVEIHEDGKLYTYNGGTLFGVISTQPGFRLNAEQKDGKYVALKGIVPVFTDYDIKAGQYCVAVSGGKVKGVDKADMTLSDFLNLVGICYERTNLDTKTCVVKV